MKKLQIGIICVGIIIVNVFSTQAQYSWTQKASLTAHNGRAFATGFSIGHYGFVGTGQDSSGYLNDFWRWNQDSNTWTKVANYPGQGRYGMTSFTIAGKGYSCLGYTGSGQAADLWEYDTTSNTWTQKANFPGAARYGAFVFVIGTKAYVGCGEPNGQPYDQDMWMYDAVANTWTQKANFPGGDRAGLCAFALNAYGYAGCGSDGLGTDYNDMYKYDTTTNTWSTVASLPIQTANSVSFVIDSLAYVGTGRNVSSGKEFHYFGSYSAATNTWKAIDTLPGLARWLGVGFSIRNKGYVCTGDTENIQTSIFLGGYLSDLWQYGPISTAGVSSIKNNDGIINVYPNPTNGVINFTYTNINTDAQLVVTDVLGRAISEYTLSGKQGKLSIDESGLNSGVYFYRVKANGTYLTSGKFIIEK